MRAFARVLRIVQVSDCHVSADPGADYRGAGADRNLAKLLPVVRQWQPDLLLLTGDISEDASAASYGRVAAMLDSVGAPVLALPGNHDDPVLMSRYFPRGPWQGPFVVEKKGWLLVLLDSTRPGQVSGILPQETLDRLDALLARRSADHVLLALHHQPVPVGSPWIDRYPLRFPQSLFGVLDRHPAVRGLVWGHVHQDFRAERAGAALLGGPSTAANSLPGKDRFTLDLGGPACRWLELYADGQIETGCLRSAQSSSTGSTIHNTT